MALHRVTGTGWKRQDGTRVERGDVIAPTPFELKTRAYKLQRVEDSFFRLRANASDEELAEALGLDHLATGGGWYDIPDVGKVQGRKRAVEEFARQMRQGGGANAHD